MKQVTLNTPFITLIVLDYGAIIQKLLVKDKGGKWTNVVVGYDFPSLYPSDKFFLGASVGRFAGRISGARFELDRENYPLYGENGTHLHGGKEGFGKKYWTIEEVDRGPAPFVRLSYTSKHLEEGYPGTLRATLEYRLIGNALQIAHWAVTDRSTIVNLANHSYFRLDKADTVNHYQLQLNSSRMVETGENGIPTGRIIPVKGTEYDFFKAKKIAGLPLDTAYVLEEKTGRAARLHSAKTGITMEVFTDQPALNVYSPPYFPGICFGTQNYPDAPNQAHFPNCVLRPGETYGNCSQFVFGREGST